MSYLKEKIKNLLIVSHSNFNKRSPSLSFEDKRRMSSESISSLLYIGLIAPLGFILMTLYFITNPNVNIEKHIGGFIFTLILLPFYLSLRKYIFNIDYTKAKQNINASKKQNIAFTSFVFICVALFFIALICSIIITRKIKYG